METRGGSVTATRPLFQGSVYNKNHWFVVDWEHCFHEDNEKDYEIIGNLYENPELLTKK